MNRSQLSRKSLDTVIIRWSSPEVTFCCCKILWCQLLHYWQLCTRWEKLEWLRKFKNGLIFSCSCWATQTAQIEFVRFGYSKLKRPIKSTTFTKWLLISHLLTSHVINNDGNFIHKRIQSLQKCHYCQLCVFVKISNYSKWEVCLNVFKSWISQR